MSKCWYCNEEITTGNNPEHLGICDKCYNEMFKCGNEFVEGLTDKIADLEAKLAESEKNYKDARELGIEQFHSLKEIINSSQEEIDKLKQHLAEKEKELEEVKNSKTYIINFGNKVKEVQVVDDNQDKISFAVEQIMQIREKIDNSEEICIGLTLDGIYEIDNIFDNQIAQLTHQHEDKGE